MKTITKLRLQKLRDLYQSYEDEDTLKLFDEKESEYMASREMKIFRENPKTQQLIKLAYSRLRVAMEKLTTDPDMPDMMRHRYFVSIEWAKWFLDELGEDEKVVDASFDELIEGYAHKAGLE